MSQQKSNNSKMDQLAPLLISKAWLSMVNWKRKTRIGNCTKQLVTYINNMHVNGLSLLLEQFLVSADSTRN